MASLPQASRAAADSVQAPANGLVGASSTTADELDLTAFASRYVIITFEGADTYWLAAAATAATIDETATNGDTTCEFSSAGTKEPFLVDPDKPFLRFKAKTGTGYVRVFQR